MSAAVVVSDTRALLSRWFIHMRRDIMSLSIGLMQPLFWLILGYVFQGFMRTSVDLASFGGVDYMSFFLSGIVAFTLLTNAVLGGIPIVFDRENGFIDKVLSAPVSRLSIVLARFIYVTIYSLVQAFLVLAFGYILLGVRFQGGFSAPVALLGIAGFGALFTAGVVALSLALAFKAEHHAVFFTITGFFLTPVLFLSSAFVPLSKLPEAGRWIALANPLTHAIDPIRALICGPAAAGISADGVMEAFAVHGGVLLAFDVVCFALAVRVIRSRLD
jgi:ABC-2 type transport system permease protein